MNTFEGKNFCYDLGKKTYIMGILNITSDSFYDGGLWNTPNDATQHAINMENDGADMIDIGAQSTRPGHIELTVNEELSIVKQFFFRIAEEITVPVSVDTFYPEVAEYCLKNGASIINDVSGKFNPKMAELIEKYKAGWIIMHTGGSDSNKPVKYKDGVVNDVKSFFEKMYNECIEFGLKPNQICFDMGIGFGKTNNDNLELIRNIDKLKYKNVALLTALSNKRVVANALKLNSKEKIYGTIAANTTAISKGSDFIRVHEVKESKLAAMMADAIYRG